MFKNEKRPVAIGVKKVKSKTDYVSEKTVYSCECYKEPPYKSKCIKGNSNKPLEERTKHLEVLKKFMKQ